MNKGMELAFYEKMADAKNYVYFKKVKCGDKTATYPHFHDSIELVLCTMGKCGVCINGKENILDEGDGAFIDRFDVHFYRYFPESEYYVLLLSEKYLDDDNGFNKNRLPEFLPKCEKYEEVEKHQLSVNHSRNTLPNRYTALSSPSARLNIRNHMR